MRSKLIIFIVVISTIMMSFNDANYREFSTADFTGVYIKNHPEVLILNHIVIVHSGWTIYLPTNEMPESAIYYTLPECISDFKSLQSLSLKGVFIKQLPTALQSLLHLKHLSISLNGKSDIKSICQTLIQIKHLETLNLTGSIISDQAFIEIQRMLPEVQVTDVIRMMKQSIKKPN